MPFYEQKEREILDVLDRFQRSQITSDELRRFRAETQQEIFTSGLAVDPEDNYSFLRCEKYWLLLDALLQGKAVRDQIKAYIYLIKADDFMERVKFSNKNTARKAPDIDRPLVYFDNNAFIHMKTHVPLDQISNRYQFVYSPAHLEELANSIRENEFKYDQRIKADLSYLSGLTNDTEFLPSDEKGIVVMSESPYDPLNRVIRDFDGTILSEQMEQDFLENRQKIKEKYSIKVRGSDIKGVLSSPAAEKILTGFSWYPDYKKEPHKRDFWNAHKAEYHFLFTGLNSLSMLLDVLDNNPEPAQKYRSHLHDTSHLIYGTASDIFVTADKRLLCKAEEIYRFLGISTQIIDYKQLPSDLLTN